MRKARLTKEERAIEQSLEEFVPVARQEFAEIVRAVEQRKRKIGGRVGRPKR